MAEAYIVAALRLAGGRRGGRLAGWHPADLGGAVLDGLVDRSGIDPASIEDVIMGCVGQAAEQTGNVGRYAVLASKLPESVPATSVDRQCGSSQQALHFAAATVMAGVMDVVVAAGVESMTRVPMGTTISLAKQAGMGGPKSPRVEARYPGIQFNQIVGAEMIAKKHGFDRAALDAFSLDSHRKSKAAVESGAFDAEILPVEITRPDGSTEMHRVDEGIRFDATIESIGSVKLLSEGGVVTAASSSQICDGASGVLVVNERGLRTLGLAPLARIHHMTVTAGDPVLMLEEPLFATERALQRSGMTIDDIDLFEVNEAFAPVPLAWLKHSRADPNRLNVHGGAIALGHPLGGSGTKLMATLVHGLHRHGKRYGLQTMCEGGGLANVTIVERC
jgi:acetyl-CoA C-acetyltransferase